MQTHIQTKKINVAVLGATGVVGQAFVSLLAGHPVFHLAVVAGSAARAGKRYGEEVHWVLPSPLPEQVTGMDFHCRMAGH